MSVNLAEGLRPFQAPETVLLSNFGSFLYRLIPSSLDQLVANILEKIGPVLKRDLETEIFSLQSYFHAPTRLHLFTASCVIFHSDFAMTKACCSRYRLICSCILGCCSCFSPSSVLLIIVFAQVPLLSPPQEIGAVLASNF